MSVIGNNWWANSGGRPPTVESILNNRPGQTQSATPRLSLFHTGAEVFDAGFRMSLVGVRRVANNFLETLTEFRRNPVNESANRETIEEILDSFNQLIRRARRVPLEEGQEVSNLEQGLTDTALHFRNALRSIGVSVGRNGFLQINEDRFRAGEQSGALERFVRDSRSHGTSSFMNSITNLVEAAGRTPEMFFRSGFDESR